MTTLLQPQFVELSTQYGLISISGPDAQSFLQGQLTCDIRQITHNQLNLGAICNLKGRIRALMQIFLKDDSYYLFMPSCIISNTLIQLKKYALFSKVKIQDANTEWTAIGLCACSSADLLSHFGPSVLVFSYQKQTAKNRFLLFAPVTQSHTILNTLSLTMKKTDCETWTLYDIRDGIPQIWLETVERFLPHDLNLPQLGAVSFDKGCYCGQEIIARMEYRAKLKRRLHFAQLKGSSAVPTPGTSLFKENAPEDSIGAVVSAAKNAEHNIEMLIETSDQYIDANNPFYINTSTKPLPITLY